MRFDPIDTDIRYASRALFRNIGFTLAVISVLGAGIGAATAVFVVADRVLIAGLPYPDSQRLVQIRENFGTICVVDIQAIEEQQRTFEAFGAVRPAAASLSAGAQAERIIVGRATSGFFAALGVRAMRGRLLAPRDDKPGAPMAMVVSYALAERSLGGAAQAVGRHVTLDGEDVEVVGVLEPRRGELAGLQAEAWPALQLAPPKRRGPFGYRGFARLKPGVTLAQARQDLAAISERIFPIWQSSFQDAAARLTPVNLQDAIVGTAHRQIGLFAGAVALVLLLAIANVGTLMMVRASAREHELGIRAALGAGRRRIARLIVTECLLLTTLSGVVALAVAAFGLKLVAYAAPELPRLAEISLDGFSVAFALALVVISGILVSLAPLSFAHRRSAVAVATLSGTAARSSAGRRANALRSAIVVAEFALALPLLFGAALLLNSFLRLQRVDVGFNPDGLYGLRVSLAGERYAEDNARLAFWRQLETRAGEISGVTGAGLASALPPDTYGDVNNFDLVDKPVPAGSSQPTAPWVSVTPGFFTALRVPLLEGRLFTDADTSTAPPVVVVSRSWAAMYFPAESVIGKKLQSGGCTTCPLTTVVGVVGDAHYRGLAGEADAVYAPLAQQPSSSVNLVVRSRLGRAGTLHDLRAELTALDPQIAPVEIVMVDRLRDALGNPRRWASIVGSFAAAGVILAALGIFGLMSYVVRQREAELGVRLALGATPQILTGMVVARGMRYAVAGTIIGLAVSVLESRWLGSMLYGVQPADPVTVTISVFALLLIAAAACVLPAFRAARIPPSAVLR